MRMPLNRSLLMLTTALSGLLLLGAAPGYAQDATESVVVTGLRNSLDSARGTKRDADTIVDSIVATDIGKFPDTNVVESLSRIPGIQISRRESEGSGISIRGLSDVKSVLNGREVFGGGALGSYTSRAFNLADLSSDVLGGIDVYKTSSADQIEGGLGGYVNVRTRRPFDFDKLTVTGTAKMDYFDRIRGLGAVATPSYSGLVADNWDTSLGKVGFLFDYSHDKNAITQDRQGATDNGAMGEAANYAGSGKTVSLPQFVFGNGVQWGFHTRDTMNGIVEWQPSSEIDVYGEFYSLDYKREVNFADYRYRAVAGTETANYTLFPGTQDLQSGSFVGNSAQLSSTVANDYRKIRQYAVGGSWNHGDLKVKLDLSRTDADNVGNLYEYVGTTTVPLMTISRDTRGHVLMNANGYDAANPANVSPNSFLSIFGGGKLKDMSGKLDGEYHLGYGIFDKIEAGVRVSQYQATSNPQDTLHFCSAGWCSYYDDTWVKQIYPYTSSAITAHPTFPATDVGVPSQFLHVYSSGAGNFLGFNTNAIRDQSAMRRFFGMPVSDPPLPDSDYAHYFENTYAAYGKLDYLAPLPAGMLFDGNIGVRYIRTNLHTTSYGADVRNPNGPEVLVMAASNREDWLPSANARLKFTDDLQLRAGVNKSLERIDLSKLNGAVVVTNPLQHEASRGNPDLLPYTSWNYDLSLEYYFGDTGMVYLAGFRKQTKGFEAPITLLNQTVAGFSGNDWKIATTANEGSGKIQGWEMGVQTFADFLPDPFDGLGIQANYTSMQNKQRSSAGGSFFNAVGPNQSANLVLMYEKGPVSVRAAYDWTGKTLMANSPGLDPITRAAYGVVDLSASYDVLENLHVTFTANNIFGYHDFEYANYRVTDGAFNATTQSSFGLRVKYDLF